MTFSEWAATYCNGMLLDGDTDDDRLVRLVARETWEAAEAMTREEMAERWNRTGVDIDAALHGRVNEKSPIAGRLRMIAAKLLLACAVGFIPIHCGRWRRSGDEREPQPDEVAWRTSCCGRFASPTHWMPLPPAPEEVATGEKEQEARDVTD